MTTDTSRPGRGPGIARAAAIGLVCVVAGFLIGWFTRGDGGTATVLPAASAPATTQPVTGSVSTATAPAAPAPPPPPEPADIRLAVLNGTSIAGFAGQTATRAEGLGYPAPEAGNAPSQTGPTVVYFRNGRRPAARRVARDLGFQRVEPLPASGPLADAAPAGAQVVVVLGPG